MAYLSLLGTALETEADKVKPDPKELIDQALQLDPASRALVAETLLESLDIGAEFEVSDEWREEIRRRCEAIDQGTTELIPGDQVLAGLRGRFR